MQRNFREQNIISNESRERLFPVDLLLSGYLNELKIRQCGISSLRKGSVIDRPSHRPYHIMIITITGQGEFIMDDGTAFTLGKGEMFFSKSDGQGHRHYPVSDEWRLCWFQINDDASWIIPFTNDYTIKKCEYTEEIVHCMGCITEEQITQNEDYSAIQNLQSQLLYRYLKRTLSQSALSRREAACVSRFNELWNEIYRNPGDDWNTDVIARFMNMSRSQSNRLCQKYFGISPAEKAREIKLSIAYSFLYNLDYSVAQVAEAVGYSSIPAFTVAFSRMFGITPGEASGDIGRIR